MHELPANLDTFLADLDIAAGGAARSALPPPFLVDLDRAWQYAAARPEPELSVAELEQLAGQLDAWRDHNRLQLVELLAQVPDDDPLRCPVSLFRTMEYGRLETAHTRMLAWLLNKHEHGFGHRLLEGLLKHLLAAPSIDNLQVDHVEAERPVHSGPTGAGMGRIDVYAKGRRDEQGKSSTWMLVIEAKIDAEEGEEQLAIYDDWIASVSPAPDFVLKVLLTPDGRKPRTSPDWQPMRFAELAGVLRRADGLQGAPGYHLLRYYLAGLLRDVCGVPLPVTKDSADPYAALDYLRSALSAGNSEATHA